jgi:hypothetical protein
VGQQQRQRRQPAAGLVDHVNHLAVHAGTQVGEPVQPRLERAGVEPPPLGQQASQPLARGAKLPPAAVHRGQPRRGQPLAQLTQHRRVKLHPDRFRGHRRPGHHPIIPHPGTRRLPSARCRQVSGFQAAGPTAWEAVIVIAFSDIAAGSSPGGTSSGVIAA